MSSDRIDPTKELSVGEVARRAGVTVSALHFYEKQGLITSTRTGGNQRRYGRETLRRVAVIRVGQRVGIPLKLIAQAFATLPEDRSPSREDWQQLSADWRSELDARIGHLVDLRDQLDDCIGCGCLSIDRCALRNPDDVLGEVGSGPRRLKLAADRPGPGADAAGPERQGF